MNIYSSKLKPDGSNIPGFIDMSSIDFSNYLVYDNLKPVIKKTHSEFEIITFENLIPEDACDHIIQTFRRQNCFSPVSVFGLKDTKCQEIGSNRITGWAPSLASTLYNSLFSSKLLAFKTNPYSYTDFYQHLDKDSNKVWKPYGISPMMRYMEYSQGGEHYAHCDAGFIYPDPKFRTLFSVVIYLSTNQSGATGFIEESQKDIPMWERNTEDWTRSTFPEERYFSSLPQKGKVLIFPHRLRHDVDKFLPKNKEEKRIIIRTDIVYVLSSKNDT